MAEPINIGLQFSLAGDKEIQAWVQGLVKLLQSIGFDTSKLNTDELIADFKKLSQEAGGIDDALDQTDDTLKRVSSSADNATRAFQFNNVLSQAQQVSDALKKVLDVGVEFEAGLAELSAITGKTGDDLDKMGEQARALALEFGGPASGQIGVFSGILSKLGPAIADDSAAMAKLVENVNILSAASGDDATTSMNAMVDTMLQLGLNAGTAADQAAASTDVINALAAGAQVGAATIPNVAQALLQAGVAAKGANIDLVETNAAIQVLATGGKVGSEAGVALRNVLGLLQKASGPAEEAMQKLGTSSKELGEILTTKGLGPAIEKLKGGLNGLETDAERNVAMMHIFGAENAAAAGILVNNVDLMADFSEGIELGMQGQGSAFEQAAVRMDTAQSGLERAKAFVEDQFISVFQALGGTLTTTLGTISEFGPTLLALSALKDLFPVGQILEFAKGIVARVIPAMFTQVAATEAGTAAQLKFNAAVLLNPWFLGGALVIGAVIGAIALFSDSVKDAETAVADLNKAQEDYDAAVATQKAVAEQAKGLNDLADEYDKLKDSTDPEDQERFAKVSESLAEKVGFASESLDKYNESGQIVGKTFLVATDEVRQFTAEQEAMAKQGADEALQRLNDQAAALGATYLSQKEDIAEAREEVEKYKEASKEVGDDAVIGFDFESVGTNLKDARLELGNLSGEQDKVITKMRQFVSGSLEAGKSIEEIAEIMSIPVEEAQALSAGLDDAGSAGAAAQGPIGDMATEIQAAADEARKLGEEFETAKQAASDFSSASIAALAQALAELDAAQKSANAEAIAAAEARVKSYTDTAKEAVKNEAEFQKFQERAESIAGKRKKKVQKRQRQERDKAEVDAEKILLLTLSELRDEYLIQTAKDDHVARLEELKQQQDAEVKALEEQLKEFEEIRKNQNNKDARQKLINAGNIAQNEADIRAAIEAKYDDLRKKARIEAYREAIELERSALKAERDAEIGEVRLAQASITKETVKGLEERFEKEKELLALQLKNELDATIATNQAIIDKQTDVQELRAKLADASTAEEKANFQALLDVELKNLETLTETEIANSRAAQVIIAKYKAEEREAETVKIREQYRIREKDLAESLERQRQLREAEVATLARLVDDIARVTEAQGLGIIDERAAAEIKQLEALKENELIIEEDYNKRRAELERNAQEEREALQSRALGIRLEAERQAAVAELEIQKKTLQDKKALAEELGDIDTANQLEEQIQATADAIAEKGDFLTNVSAELQTNLTDVFSNLFSGDTEKIKEPFKKAFNVMVGALQRLASAKITEVILGSIVGPLGLGGLAVSIGLRPLIEASINSLLGPVLDSLTSFGYGGRVDFQQVAIVGDNPQGGNQTEWILRDENIMLMLSESGKQMALIVAREMDRVVDAIEGKEFTITEREVNQANNRARSRAARSTYRKFQD